MTRRRRYRRRPVEHDDARDGRPTTAPICRRSSSASPRPSTTRSPRRRLYMRRGLGPADAPANRAVQNRAQGAEQARRGAVPPRDRSAPVAARKAIALVPSYAGTWIAEIMGLDVADVLLSALKGNLRISARPRRSATSRSTPPAHRADRLARRTRRLARRRHRRCSQSARRSARVRGAHDIITAIATAAGLDEDTPPTSCATRSPHASCGPHGIRHCRRDARPPRASRRRAATPGQHARTPSRKHLKLLDVDQ